MTPYRDVLGRLLLGEPRRMIARQCAVSSRTITRCRQAIEANALTAEKIDALSDEQLMELLGAGRKHSYHTQSADPDMEEVLRGLVFEHVSRRELWSEYAAQCEREGARSLNYSRFCDKVSRYMASSRVTGDPELLPGRALYLHWLSTTLIDEQTGEVRKVRVWVGILPYSGWAAAFCAVRPGEEEWARVFGQVLTRAGAAPRVLAVRRNATMYRTVSGIPEIRPMVREALACYQIALRDDGETMSETVQKECAGILRELDCDLQENDFFSSGDLQTHLDLWADRRNRAAQGSVVPQTVLERNERPYMRSLPKKPFEPYEERDGKIQFNSHVQVKGVMYSVPWQYVLEKDPDVLIRLYVSRVEIFHDGERIAVHSICREGRYATRAEHMPSREEEERLPWNHRRFVRWAEQIGPGTAAVIGQMLRSSRFEQQAYRSCLTLLKLSEAHGAAALERACVGLSLEQMNLREVQKRI